MTNTQNNKNIKKTCKQCGAPILKGMWVIEGESLHTACKEKYTKK